MIAICMDDLNGAAESPRELTDDQVEVVSGGFWSEVLIDLAKGFVKDLARGAVNAAGQWVTNQMQANEQYGPNPQYATDAMGGVYAPVNDNDH